MTVDGSASGTITLGDYSIAGTGYPALLGPARSTVVNSPVAAPDSYTTTPGHPAESWRRLASWPTTPIRTAMR